MSVPLLQRAVYIGKDVRLGKDLWIVMTVEVGKYEYIAGTEFTVLECIFHWFIVYTVQDCISHSQ